MEIRLNYLKLLRVKGSERKRIDAYEEDLYRQFYPGYFLEMNRIENHLTAVRKYNKHIKDQYYTYSWTQA